MLERRRRVERGRRHSVNGRVRVTVEGQREKESFVRENVETRAAAGPSTHRLDQKPRILGETGAQASTPLAPLPPSPLLATAPRMPSDELK